MDIVKPSAQSAHYYTTDGKPMFEIMGKTTGRLRPVTIRDAKKNGWLPSSTTIIHGATPTPYGLELYKLEQMALLWATTPDIRGESLQEKCKRIADEYEAESKKASSLGTEVHDLIAKYLKNDSIPFEQFNPDAVKAFEKVRPWIDENILGGEVEQIKTNLRLGYAGTIDYSGAVKNIPVSAMIDWKSQNVKLSKKGIPYFNFYDEWIYQGGSYTMTLDPNMPFISVIIPTSDVEFCDKCIKVWKPEEVKRGQEIFKQLIRSYRLLNNFPYEAPDSAERVA